MQAAPEKPLLLIVDDDELIVDAMSYFLGTDFEVLVADSRHQAIRILRQGKHLNGAIIDLGLPPTPHRPDMRGHWEQPNLLPNRRTRSFCATCS